MDDYAQQAGASASVQPASEVVSAGDSESVLNPRSWMG